MREGGREIRWFKGERENLVDEMIFRGEGGCSLKVDEMIFEGGSKIMCPSEVDEMILLTDKKHFINLRERYSLFLFFPSSFFFCV